jgi:hypothetical protein
LWCCPRWWCWFIGDCHRLDGQKCVWRASDIRRRTLELHPGNNIDEGDEIPTDKWTDGWTKGKLFFGPYGSTPVVFIELLRKRFLFFNGRAMCRR